MAGGVSIGNLARLGEELVVCRRRGASIADAVRLGADTVAFHVSNRLRRPVDYRRCSRYALRIGGRVVDVHLRRHAGDLFVFHEVFTSGAYQLPRSSRAVQTVLDLGSHVGLTSLYWLETMPNARVVCVEAAPDNAALLRKNLAGFSDRVAIIEGAISTRSGTITFADQGASWERGVVADSGRGRQVRAVTIDEVIASSGLTQIDLLKVDIEGAEAGLFDRVHAWMSMVHTIIIEIHPPFTIEQFASTVESAGLRLELPSDETEHQMIVAARPATTERRQRAEVLAFRAAR